MTTLVAILFCLSLQRFANLGGQFGSAWFELYLKSLNRVLKKPDSRLAIPLIIVPVWLVFLILHLVFKGSFFGLYDLLMAVVILFLAVDARDFKNKLKPYFTALAESNTQGAIAAASDFVDSDFSGDMLELQKSVSKGILIKSFERIFAGLFWFIFFGIYGLSGYFLITLIKHQALKVSSDYINLAKFAAKLQNILEWLPSRFVGFSYALVGRFSKGSNYCLANLWGGLDSVRKFAFESGLAALDLDAGDSGDEENHAALDIINRVLIIWLVAVVFALLGFLL